MCNKDTSYRVLLFLFIYNSLNNYILVKYHKKVYIIIFYKKYFLRFCDKLNKLKITICENGNKI